MGFGETDNVPLLEVHDLRTTFFTDGGVVPAVDGVSLCIPCGRTVALVGESGCGKSVTALSLMRLIPQPPGRIVGGRVLLHAGQAADMSPRKGGDTSPLKEVAAAPRGGRKTPKNAASGRAHRVSQQADRGTVDLLTLSERRMRSVRGGQIAMIFQEPMTSLNPVFSIGEQIVEAIELHQRLRGKTAWAAAVDQLRRVGIAAPERRAHDYPPPLSGLPAGPSHRRRAHHRTRRDRSASDSRPAGGSPGVIGHEHTAHHP